MKFFSLLASVFLLFFTSLLILGVVSGSDSEVNESITIEAPNVVVLKELIDFDNYQKWCPNIIQSDYDPNTQLRQTTYLIDKHLVKINEKIQFILSENIILFTEQSNIIRGYIQNFNNEIHLQENSDGTTEIHWEIRYTLKPMLSKILNIFVVKPVIKKILHENLNALKINFEGS